MIYFIFMSSFLRAVTIKRLNNQNKYKQLLLRKLALSYYHTYIAHMISVEN